MKKPAKVRRDPNLLPEYDSSQGTIDKYAERYAEGTNLVVLSPDVMEFFPDSESMNAAPRMLVGIARKSAAKTARRPEAWGERAEPGAAVGAIF